jgi:hypothetical protein
MSLRNWFVTLFARVTGFPSPSESEVDYLGALLSLALLFASWLLVSSGNFWFLLPFYFCFAWFWETLHGLLDKHKPGWRAGPNFYSSTVILIIAALACSVVSDAWFSPAHYDNFKLQQLRPVGDELRKCTDAGLTPAVKVECSAVTNASERVKACWLYYNSTSDFEPEGYVYSTPNGSFISKYVYVDSGLWGNLPFK